jgi:protein TonB
MNLRSLHGPSEPAGAGRWIVCALAIGLAHVGLVAAAVAWYQLSPPPGVSVPAIMVDMAPASAAPETQPEDVAPGPQMQQAEAPAPEPEPVASEPLVTPPPETSPPQDKPEVMLPPEQPPVPKPQQAQIVPDPPKVLPRQKPKERPKQKPKPQRAEPKRPSEQPPAPRTTAAPRAERQASLASAARSGAAAAAAALPSYRDRLAGHLQRYKQYPAGSKAAGEQGVAMLSFTVGRGGQLLASRLARSSGSAALDAETLAMVRRAQPLPAFPPEMTQASLSFTVPVRFSLR